MPAYPGSNVAIDLSIKIWKVPIHISGTIEPVAIMKALGEEPRPAGRPNPGLRLEWDREARNA